MKLQKPFKRENRSLLIVSALVLAAVAFSAPAMSQETNTQLSAQAAEEQVPAAFPDINIPQAAPEDAAKKASRADIAAEEATEAKNAPPAPEEKKLVPATAMGAAAQKVENNKEEGAPETAEAPAQDASSDLAAQLGATPADDKPNTVEDAAAQVEDDSAPALPDILEKYGSKPDEVGKEDALPDVGAPAMSDLGLEAGTGAVTARGQTQEQLQNEIRTEAYDAALTGTFPLSPDQVKTLMKRYDETQEAVQTPVYKLPTPEITVQNISLDPGIVPPTIKTAVGNVTTINMLDATGSPWPVQDVTWAGDFEVVEPEEGGHIIRITPMEHFARGNIVIRLLTLKTPLTLTLETSRDTVQYRVDARIPEYGPFAAAPLMQGAKSTIVAGSPDLTS
jgi:hypothetical protein